MDIDYDKKLKILLIDDIKVHRFLMISGMSRINPFLVMDEASSVVEAIAKLSDNNQYNAVLCDWLMPDGGGEELIAWMRMRPHFQHVPFIMVSGKTHSQDIISAFIELGVDAYVMKPAAPKKLYETMVIAIRKKLLAPNILAKKHDTHVIARASANKI